MSKHVVVCRRNSKWDEKGQFPVDLFPHYDPTVSSSKRDNFRIRDGHGGITGNSRDYYVIYAYEHWKEYVKPIT